MKIGLLRETKTPPDRRVALPPVQAAALMRMYPGLQIMVQSSPIRCFSDEEYLQEGVTVQEELKDCDLLIGIKEVKIPALIEDKQYLFFAHVAKKQVYNKPLLKALLEKRIILSDYEYFTDTHGIRLIAFGRWAGIIGAYNGIRAWGLKTGRFMLKAANSCYDRQEMDDQLKGLDLGPVRILVTGGGRVAHGAMETLDKLTVPVVSHREYCEEPRRTPVICRIDPEHYTERIDGVPFDFAHFCNDPQAYRSRFRRFYPSTDLFLAAHFWDPLSPRLWEPEEMLSEEFRIRVISDISCDINGAVPSTIRSSKIAEPFYDFDPVSWSEKPPFSDARNVTVMAIDNLPGELPRDASEEFAGILIERIMPCLQGDDPDQVVERATITRDGALTERFRYLQDFVDQPD
ncbi:MAG TPA: alanine dehydrogenase [Bacteroidales bacterium]|nr:alanine dehydrogenase [Bacteroidales bacterium]